MPSTGLAAAVEAVLTPLIRRSPPIGPDSIGLAAADGDQKARAWLTTPGLPMRRRGPIGGTGLAPVERPPPSPTVGFHPPPHLRVLLFDQGRNVKQVAEWLGHADPALTLRTYVHLMDAGVGAADFLDEAVAAPSRNKDRIAVDPA